MTLLALIRHAATDWNEAGLIQGRTDRPLSEVGRIQAASWRVPAALEGFDWLSSPLARARETARLLLGREVPSEPALAEAAWGSWEGRSLGALRAELGSVMGRLEARGLEFRAPGGESPREVQQRIVPWLAALARQGRSTAAITHKGVIRAVLALATGWDYLGKPPARLDWRTAQLFAIEPGGAPRIERLNIPLA